MHTLLKYFKYQDYNKNTTYFPDAEVKRSSDLGLVFNIIYLLFSIGI